MSVMGNEFSGLPMDELIGGPLKAACDAQIRLAKATADFINTVGFNPEIGVDNKPTGKFVPRNVDFSFWKPVPISQKEALASGTVTLTGPAAPPAAGVPCSVDSLKVGNGPNAVDILGVSVNYDTDLNTTAARVAAQITKFSSKPAYTATAQGAVITITASPGSGSSPNGFAIAIGVTGMTAPTTTAMNGGVDGGAEAQVQKVVLSVPFLAIVNVPALMIKNVNITFDMEVKTSEEHKDEQKQEASLDLDAKFGFGPISGEIKIHGAVSAHQENTRSTDRSAKYHVEVQARDDGMPEGLSRVLDILQNAIAPVSLSKATSLQSANIAPNQAAVA